MSWNDAILVFAPPPWPTFLPAVAAVLIACELGLLLGDLWRGRPAGKALPMMLSLVGGPVTSLAAAVFAGGGGRRGASGEVPGAGASAIAAAPSASAGTRALIRAPLVFTLLVVLSAAVYRWPLPGSVAAITVCAAAWALRAYSRTTAPTRSQVKTALLALRIAAILLLGLWAAGPQLEYPVTRKIRRTLLVGVDLSRSMQVRDVTETKVNPTSGPHLLRRIDAVQAALDSSRRPLERLAERADVRVFGFAAGPQPIEELSEDRPAKLALPPAAGTVTALGDSAQAAVDAALRDGAELAGVVLLTDGCNNTAETVTPERLAARLAVSGVPLHTVGVGSDEITPATRGLFVRDLSAPDQVEAFNRLPFRATIEAFGLEGRQVRVSYRFGNEANLPITPSASPSIESNSVQVLRVQQARETITAAFVHVPLASGYQRLVVRVECLDPPEGLAGQFQADKLVQVVDRGLRILYLEGLYRYEIKFLTQALAAAGRFSIDRRIMLQPLRPDSPAPLSDNLEDWLKYHAVILGDLPAGYLSERQRQVLKDLVGRYGKGLCMIGGTQSFGCGGWDKTPLADVMPVDLAASNGQIDSELRVVPTTEGLADPLMAIGKEGQSPAAAWAELSPLPGANKLQGVKPGAAVLATTADGAPLIVSQRYGAGRALAVAFDMTWLWVTTRDTGESQRRFWRQVALYLCQPKGNVWVTTDKPRYDLDRLAGAKERVEVTVGVEDPQGHPMPDAPVKLTLTAPDGKAVPLALAPAEDQRRAARLSAVQLPAPGLYSLKLEAEVAGKALSAEHQFDVQQRDLEALDTLANLALLRRLAEETKGRFVPLSSLSDLLVELHDSGAEPRTERRIEHFDLAAHFRWPIVVTILSLLCIEWAVRKRRGLV